MNCHLTLVNCVNSTILHPRLLTFISKCSVVGLLPRGQKAMYQTVNPLSVPHRYVYCDPYDLQPKQSQGIENGG